MNFNLSTLITFLIELVIIGLVIYAINWFIGTLTLPQPIKTIILVIISLIALVFLLNSIGLTHISL